MGFAEKSLLRSATTGDVRERAKTKNPKKTFAATGRQEVPICYDFVQGKCRRQNCRLGTFWTSDVTSAVVVTD